MVSHDPIFEGPTELAAELARCRALLADAQAMLRAIVDHSTDHVLIRDLEGRFILMNPCGAAVLGREPAELVGLDVEAVFGPDTAARIRATDRQVIESGEAMEYEARIDLRDGRSHVARTLKYPYRAPDGRIAGVVAVSRDITAQAQARALLHRREAEFHALVEMLPVMVARLDREARYLYVNRAVEALAGRPRAWYLGKSARELGYPADVADELEGVVRGVFEDGQERIHEFRWEFPDGPRWYHRRLVPVMGLDGQPETVLSVLLDLTERQRQVEELEALSRLRSQFVSAVSHELRTPLTSLMGYAEFLDEGVAGALNDGQRAFLSAIQANAGRLGRLVDDLLDCAASESGTFHLERQPADLVEMVAGCLEAMAPQARQAGIMLRSEVDAHTLPVFADAGRILQVLGNLVGNALKFTPGGGTIVVRACREPAGVRCEVEDDGPGIPAEQQGHLFERFRQAAPTSPRMGLGLAISRTIVEAHGGDIGIESAPGAGSTFWFTLPA